MRKVFGVTLGGGNKPVEVYERVHTGLGDGVMLRPAIIGNMKRYPNRRHVLHIYSGIACIFEDIQGLEIVPIIQPQNIKSVSDGILVRYNMSMSKMMDYKDISNIYRLSSPCADYESENSPYTSIVRNKIRVKVSRDNEYYPTRFPRMYIEKYEENYAMPTGKKIAKSRQKIFSDVVGVDFSMDNYNIQFSNKEKQIADDFVEGHDDLVGVCMRSSTYQRDYKYMIDLVEYIAGKANAVITFDSKWEYGGRRSNVISNVDTIRNKWAVMSKLSLMISPDTFGVHAAGALGIPTYGMFGPTDPVCRLKDYVNAKWNDRWSLPILRRGFKRGCGRQYCWYKPCKLRNCLNAMSPKYYWEDAVAKLGVVL